MTKSGKRHTTLNISKKDDEVLEQLKQYYEPEPSMHYLFRKAIRMLLEHHQKRNAKK